MQIADRAKMTGTATSDAVYALTAAVAGFQNFFDGFNFTSFASVATVVEFVDVPLLIESGDDWQIVTGTVWRSNVSDTVAIKDAIFRDSSTGSALGLTGGQAVTISVVPIKHVFNSLVVDTLTFADAAEEWNDRPRVRTAFSTTDRGIMAAGRKAIALSVGSLSLGHRANASYVYGAAIGGYNSYIHHAGQLGIGLGNTKFDGHEVYQGIATGQLNAYTANATPTKLGYYTGNNDATEAAVLVAGTEDIWINSGLTTIKGIVSAYCPDTDDRKVWEFTVIAEQNMAYGGASIAVETFTELLESAGATAWAVDATVSGDNLSFTVTGAAATDLLWTCTYTMHAHGFDQ